MDVNGFRNYVHMDEYGRVDKEKARKEAGAEVSDRSEGTEEKRQRNK